MTRPRPITFVRPDPSPFGILITKIGRGTDNLIGTEHFKPPNCEWATDEDLRDAGYVPVETVRRLAEAAAIGTMTAEEITARLVAISRG